VSRQKGIAPRGLGRNPGATGGTQPVPGCRGRSGTGRVQPVAHSKPVEMGEECLFEPPLKLFGHLALDLPSTTYEPYRFLIAAPFVERVELPKPPPVAENVPPPPAPTPPPPPYNPETDPQVRARVLAAYNADFHGRESPHNRTVVRGEKMINFQMIINKIYKNN
jgi:hypothetical protein